MNELVPPHVAALIDAEREALGRLRELLSANAVEDEIVEGIGAIIEQLDALFLIVVVGEFNAGKSSVINALFGERILEEGPVPTTLRITHIRGGSERVELARAEDLFELRHPSPMLRHLNLVDTPGTNSIIRQHETLTRGFIPRADLVLFITSYDRPLSESEHQFLRFMREVWGKRLVFAVNKIDLSRRDGDLERVLEHVRSGSEALMGLTPPIFPISAELAFEAKLAERESVRETLWEKSRFGPFEDFIHETLTGATRLQMKLNAPLDAADQQLSTFAQRLEVRRQGLAQDEANIEELEQRLGATRERLHESCTPHLDGIDKLILEMERRGVRFLDDTIRIGRLKLLRDRDLFKETFIKDVVADLDRQIETGVSAAIDQLISQTISLWEEVLRDFARRVQQSGHDGVIPQGKIDYNRETIFNAMMVQTRQQLTLHDVREEARRILEAARQTSDHLRGLQMGAAGIGVLGVVLMITTTLDALGGAGILTGGVVALAGLALLPRQRRKAIKTFKEQVARLQGELREAIEKQLHVEVAGAIDRVRGTTDPYQALVDRELKSLRADEAEQEALRARFAELRERVLREVGGD